MPRLLGAGTSNGTWTVPGTNDVQRWPLGDINALDLRVVTDTDARSALVDSASSEYSAAATPHGEPLTRGQASLRLAPHATDPTSTEAGFDRCVGDLIDELAHLSHNSEAAAHALMPKARQSIEILTSLPEVEVPLRCAPDAGDSAVLRAFTVRVAEVVTAVIGEELVRSFGLPTPRELERDLPPAYDDPSSLALAHGDPTVSNVMWALNEPVLTDWELARPAPMVSAAAHTLAALVTRAPYPIRRSRLEQFTTTVAGARAAVDLGVYATYHQYEVARAPWVDVLRGLRGEVDAGLVHRNVARFLGDRAPSLDRVHALLDANADRDFPLPVLPHNAAIHLAEPPPDPVHPREGAEIVLALSDEVMDRAAAVLSPDVYHQHRSYLHLLGSAMPPVADTVLEIGRRLRVTGMTEMSVVAEPDRLVYRFREHRPTAEATRESRRPRGSDATEGTDLTKGANLAKGD